jgi:hypothetical protein
MKSLHIPDRYILDMVDPDKFWAKVDCGRPNECWPWTRGTTRDGYGIVKLTSNRSTLAHRVAYLLGTGNHLGELNALHRCDYPPCCNYQDHIFPGTDADNMLDMAIKGRGRGGEKLTSEDVADIKLRYSKGMRATEIAAIYDIHRVYVTAIVRGVAWYRDSTRVAVPEWSARGLRKPNEKLTDLQGIKN